MTLRQDVQLLRGVAVLVVVLFHLDLLSNGFLGVDVFFVISGYLMAVMYDPERKRLFYAKRATRLLPPYVATLAATVAVAGWITTPNDFVQVRQQSWFAAFFVSNIGFWAENSYFDKAAFKPLLHLWSLGLEIQFYAIVPVVHWYTRRTRLAGLLLLIAVSLATCLLLVTVSPKTAFFWLPSRVWEFLIGFGIARYASARQSAIGLSGLAIIAIAFLLPVEGTATSVLRGHPALPSLIACLGTGVVLTYGLSAQLMNTRLSAAVCKLGDWSYSVYLAHFPVIVLALYQPFSGTVLKPAGAPQLFGVVSAVFAASAALYVLVEKPLRHRKLNFGWIGAALVGTAAACSLIEIMQKATLPPAEAAIYAAWSDRDVYRCGKAFRVLHPRSQACTITPDLRDAHTRILLVGNSHSDSIKQTFAQAAAERGASVHFLVDNSPLMPGGLSVPALMALAQGLKVDAMVLHYSPEAVNAQTVRQVGQLAGARGIQVSFVMPVPVWRAHVPQMLWSNLKRHTPVEAQTLNDYDHQHAELRRQLADVRVYEVAPLLCAPNCRLVQDDGRPLYFDDEHLTRTGSELLRHVFDRVVDDILMVKPQAAS